MKKRLISILITLCMVLTLLPCTVSAEESFDSFAARMRSEYDVIIACERDKPLTAMEQGYIEQALIAWGKEFIVIMSRALGKYGYEDKPGKTRMNIIVSNSDDAGKEAGIAGMASGNIIYLYDVGWDNVTLLHELAHMVVHACEYVGDNSSNDSKDIRNEFEAVMRKANSEAKSTTGDYGSAWQWEADTSFYAWSYGKTSPHEDIATLMSRTMDSEWVEKVKNGEMPVITKKLQAYREFYEKYLTGGIVPCFLIDNILGPSSNRPADPKSADFKSLPKTSMNAGETFKFEVGTCYPLTVAGSFKIASLRTEDPKVIKVDNETGSMTAVSEGTTLVTCWMETETKVKYGRVFEITVIGSALPTGFRFDFPTTVHVGDKVKLTATLLPEGSVIPSSYYWGFAPTNVLIIKDGECVALKPGKATIYLFVSYTNIKVPVEITVLPAEVTGITLNETEVAKPAGSTLQLKPTLSPAGATGTVTYSSSDENVATVNDKGLVTAKKAGTAIITAQVGTYTATCKVTVTAPTLVGIRLTPNQAGIKVGQTLQLATTFLPEGAVGGDVSYTSSNPDVATVSNTGLVTGIKAGTVTITVKSGKFSSTNKITVSNIEPTGITLDKSTATVEPGKTVQLKATVIPQGAAGTVSFTSSNTSVATVSSTGLVTGVKAGTATITAKVGKYSATCTVKVLDDGKKDTDEADNKNLKAGVNVLSYPTKKNYEIGEGFDKAGLDVVYYANGKQTNINDKITFYTSKTVELTQGRPFTTAGNKVVELRYEGKKVAEYTITVTEKQVKAKHPFTDVKSGAYYENPVIWALNNGITTGTSATTFAPNETCTRGQVVTFLWRANGSPKPTSSKNPFTDVKSTDYFYKAVLWAVEKGITNGTSATTFSPNEKCTSGQVVTFLWRSNGKPQANGTSSLAVQHSGKFYTDAVAWADSMGLLSGIAFDPNQNSPRADIVTYLYRNAGSPAIQ